MAEKTKEGICDSLALSAFLNSENEGKKGLKARIHLCACVRRRPADELEKKVTCICIG